MKASELIFKAASAPNGAILLDVGFNTTDSICSLGTL